MCRLRSHWAGPFALNALLFSTALQKLVPNFNVQLQNEADPGGVLHTQITSITATVAFLVGLLQVVQRRAQAHPFTCRS